MNIDQKKIATIHDIYLDFNTMSDQLRSLKEKYPSGLIIPILGSDIESPGLKKIVDEINQCDYLSKVLVALSSTGPGDYEESLRLSRSFKVPCEVVWCNKPEVITVLEELKEKVSMLLSYLGKAKTYG
jgi:hypothetical protein